MMLLVLNTFAEAALTLQTMQQISTTNISNNGTITSSGSIYSGGVQLTCFGIEHLKYGQVDLARWDSPLARRFVDMLAEFDPRDPDQYIARLLDDEALPGMPTVSEWKSDSKPSLDEM